MTLSDRQQREMEDKLLEERKKVAWFKGYFGGLQLSLTAHANKDETLNHALKGIEFAIQHTEEW